MELVAKFACLEETWRLCVGFEESGINHITTINLSNMSLKQFHERLERGTPPIPDDLFAEPRSQFDLVLLVP